MMNPSEKPPKPKRRSRPAAPQPTEHAPPFRPDSNQDEADDQLSAYLRRIDLGLESYPNSEKPKT
jgi:hypothetical protein